MNTLQKSILVNAGIANSLLCAVELSDQEKIDSLLGRKISFCFNGVDIKLLLTCCVYDIKSKNIILSFYSCLTAGMPGLLGLVITPTGALQLRTIIQTNNSAQVCYKDVVDELKAFKIT